MAAGIFPPRRWYGLLCLVLGASMLVWGQTVLATRLEGKTFIIYWTLCFLVTGMALILALWETRRLRIQLQEEEKALFREMVRQIELARREKEARGQAVESPVEKEAGKGPMAKDEGV